MRCSVAPTHDSPTPPWLQTFRNGKLRAWTVDFVGSRDTLAARDTLAIRAGDTLGGESLDGPPPAVLREGPKTLLAFPDTCCFEIDTQAKRILAFDVVDGAPDADLTHLLYDHVAPRIIADLGHLVLHASAVDFGGALALFLGPTGAGKSSLAASLEGNGRRLLGDDAVVVEPAGNGTFVGEAVYPSLRLFPAAISALVGEGAKTELMAGYSDKRHVKLEQLAERAGLHAPVAAMFFLDGAAETDACTVAPLSPTRACIQLIEQSFSMDPTDPKCGARRLAACSALCLKVPAFQLSYPRDFKRLPEVHQLIESTLEALQSDSTNGAAE